MTDRTLETMRARIAELEAANADLKVKKETFKIKTAPKGGVSVYLGGRFPTTLYAQQWEHLLNHADEIRQYIDSNRETLAVK